MKIVDTLSSLNSSPNAAFSSLCNPQSLPKMPIAIFGTPSIYNAEKQVYNEGIGIDKEAQLLGHNISNLGH